MADSSFKNIIPCQTLAKHTSQIPKFQISIKNSKEENIHLADPKATRALLACMNMEAGLRGAASHWGGPSALAEIMSSLYGLLFYQAKKEDKAWFDLFHLINDAGHCENGLYALKANYGMANLQLEDLKKFRSIESQLTGHGEAHLFPEGVYLSNGPLGSTLAQAQGLAMADKLLGNKRMTISILSDGACMEGEAKEALSAIPGFASKNKLNPFLLIISDNNTKLTGRIEDDSFSLQPFLKSLSIQGWESHFIPQGNSLEPVFHSLEKALETASSQTQKPLVLIFKTRKGFGVKKTEEDSSGGHGFPLKNPKELPSFIQEIYGKEKIPEEILNWCKDILQFKPPVKSSSSLKKTQVGISKALIEQKQKGMPLVSISADLQGSTGLAPFRKEYPEHSFDVGVAESNMISTATGFSKQGFIPIIDTFSQFAVTKGSLPLIMSALSQAPVIGIFSHSGFQDAADGASHQALSYFAKTCSLPKTQVFTLSCAEEAYHLLSQAIETFYKIKKSGAVPDNYIFFLGRETFPESFGVTSYDLNKAQILFDNSKGEKPCLIVTGGSLVGEALKAGEELKKQGRGSVIVNNPCVSHPDTNLIASQLEVCENRLITLEEHQAKGGFASILLLALKEKSCMISQFKSLSVRGNFGRSAYKAGDLYKLFGLDKDAILKTALRF